MFRHMLIFHASLHTCQSYFNTLISKLAQFVGTWPTLKTKRGNEKDTRWNTVCYKGKIHSAAANERDRSQSVGKECTTRALLHSLNCFNLLFNTRITRGRKTSSVGGCHSPTHSHNLRSVAVFQGIYRVKEMLVSTLTFINWFIQQP